MEIEVSLRPTAMDDHSCEMCAKVPQVHSRLADLLAVGEVSC